MGVGQADLLIAPRFNTVLEAAKGLAERDPRLSDIDADSAKLVDTAFGGRTPVSVFDTLRDRGQRFLELSTLSVELVPRPRPPGRRHRALQELHGRRSLS